MAARLRDERGNVLVIAVTMVGLMFGLGSAVLATVDTQTDVVTKERRHESTFNLAEGVLNAQTFVLARLGTGSPTTQFPSQCSNGSTEALCPDDEQIRRSYDPTQQSDYSGAIWRTEVRDNPSGSFYNAATVGAAPRYDANGDQQLWVRAHAEAGERERDIVALISVEFLPVAFPRFALVGGWFRTSNNGRTLIVDAAGSLGIGVRCNQPPTSSCLDYQANKGQLSPAGAYQLDYPSTPAVLPDALRALEDSARANGTYYTGCPSNPNGQIVVIESGNCPYVANTPAAPGMSRCCNAPSKPGLLIMKCGSVSIGSNLTFHGLIYVPNVSSSGSWCSSDAVVTAHAGGMINGGVIIDGPGGMQAGSNGQNIVFNPNAFDNIQTAGTAGVVQNTWREVPDDN